MAICFDIAAIIALILLRLNGITAFATNGVVIIAISLLVLVISAIYWC